jgi:hypothetical protein
MADQQQQDVWAKAREAQREDVAKLFAPRRQTCPACGAEQETGGRRCDTCGADLIAHRERTRARRPLLFAGIVAVVLVAIAIPVVSGLRDDAATERDRAAAAQKERIAAEKARQIRDARPVRAAGVPVAAGEDVAAHRQRLLADAEDKITADARARVQAGTLDGDIKGTECEVFPETDARRAAETDPATHAARYDCVAYTSKLESVQERTAIFGHPFWLVIDYDKPGYVWCKVTPRAGEGGSVLISVPVPEPCRDPDGPG